MYVQRDVDEQIVFTQGAIGNVLLSLKCYGCRPWMMEWGKDCKSLLTLLRGMPLPCSSAFGQV